MMNRDPNPSRKMSPKKPVGTEDLPDKFPEPLPEDYGARSLDRGGFESILAGVGALDELRARTRSLLAKRSVDEFAGFAAMLRGVLPAEEGRRDQIADGVRLHPSTLEALSAGEVFVTKLDPEPVVLLAYTMGLSADQFTMLVEKDLEMSREARLDEEVRRMFHQIWPDSI